MWFDKKFFELMKRSKYPNIYLEIQRVLVMLWLIFITTFKFKSIWRVEDIVCCRIIFHFLQKTELNNLKNEHRAAETRKIRLPEFFFFPKCVFWILTSNKFQSWSNTYWSVVVNKKTQIFMAFVRIKLESVSFTKKGRK